MLEIKVSRPDLKIINMPTDIHTSVHVYVLGSSKSLISVVGVSIYNFVLSGTEKLCRTSIPNHNLFLIRSS